MVTAAAANAAGGLGPDDRAGVGPGLVEGQVRPRLGGSAGGSAAAVSGTSTRVDPVTVARSAAGVISMAVPGRADTCP